MIDKNPTLIQHEIVQLKSDIKELKLERSRLRRVVDNYLLQECRKCGHYHQSNFCCHECGYDNSV